MTMAVWWFLWRQLSLTHEVSLVLARPSPFFILYQSVRETIGSSQALALRLDHVVSKSRACTDKDRGNARLSAFHCVLLGE